MTYVIPFGSKLKKNYVLRITYCDGRVWGSSKGGDSARGSSKNLGKLKFTGFIHFGSKLKKSHVLHITYCEGRVQEGVEGGVQLLGMSSKIVKIAY